ncbi:hypothetical protein GCM10009837_32450 [Streptomyces durmitorensis]
MRGEEARDEQEQRGGYAEDRAARRLQRLRQQVEADHAEHQAAREPEDEVAPVSDPLGRPAAHQSHHKGAERHEHRHAPLLADSPPAPHIHIGRAAAAEGPEAAS